MTNTSHPEVLVLGGGAIGLSLAWELALRGMATALVDRRELGREASWAAAGMIPTGPDRTHWAQASPHERLAGLSQRLHSEWHERLLETTGIDNGFDRTGAIHIADSESVATLDAELRRAQSLGIRAERLASGDLAQLEPALTRRPQAVAAADFYADEAQVRSPRHLRALEQACQQAGVTFYRHCSVERWQRDARDAKRILGVETNRGPLRAKQFCVALGCWSGNLLEPLGVRLTTTPVRGQIALVEGSPGMLRRHLCVGRRYLVPRRDGRVLIGSTEEEVGFDATTTAEAIDELKGFASQFVPALAECQVSQAWAGLRPCTSDGLPKLGRCPQMENLWLATGHYRGGVQLAPATAVALADLLARVEPTLDLSDFSP